MNFKYGIERSLQDRDRIKPLQVRPMPISSPPPETFGPSPNERIEALKRRLAQVTMQQQNIVNSVPPPQPQMPQLPWGGVNYGSALQRPMFQSPTGTSFARTDTLLPAPYRRI